MPERDPEEQAYLDLQRMFKEYDLSEYKGAWETFKDYFERVCKENREMKLHKGVKGNGKGETAA